LEIYERLAKRNPDAFEPDLAMSFGAMGAILMAAGKELDAADSFLMGINTLKRLFLGNQAPFAQLMIALLKDYINACKAAKIEPNEKALASILEKFDLDKS
jgi:hypothetical protein